MSEYNSSNPPEPLIVEGLSHVLLESSPSCIMIMRPLHDRLNKIFDFEIAAVNTLACSFLGDVKMGTKYHELCPGGKDMGLLDKYIKAYESKEAVTFESFYPFKTGMNLDRWFRQKVYPYDDGIVISFEDISPKKEVEELLGQAHDVECKYTSLFNSLNQGFCIIEVIFAEDNTPYDYRFLEINPAFIKQTGLENAEGKTMLELNPSMEKYWFEIYGKVVRTKEPIAFEHETVLINGWYEVYAYPLGDENDCRVAVLFSNVTARKQAEKKAEDERRVALDMLKFKQRFLSSMSHEIRTPLTAVIGFTEELVKSELNTEQRKYVDAIRISGDAMLDIANDILDYAKVNEGKVGYDEHPFQLDACVRNMLLLFETKIKQKRLTLINRYDRNIPTILIGDSASLNQIIMNLVSNAVKFTKSGEIRVDTSLLRNNETEISVEISVSDTGIGIRQEHLEKIFENFEQIDSENVSEKGTGLGLSIVKQLVENQGGTIRVKSDFGKGSIFTVVLTFKSPVYKHDKNKALVQQPNTFMNKTATALKILVVDDVQLNQMLMHVVLTNMGFTAEVAKNGKEAVELIKKNRYDLILMDIQMPIMNGFEATEIIRNELMSTIPIIALTADITSNDIQKIKQAGMDDYATKPIKQETLFLKIKEVMKLP